MAARSEAVYPVTWKDGKVASWLVTVDHKRIGIMYICTALVFFGGGGIAALLMRAQLAVPNENVPDEELVQRGDDVPRDVDDLPRRRADPRRLCELPRSADDRCA